MHNHNVAAAYAKTAQTTLAPKGVELKAFMRVNGQLMAASNNPNTPMTELAKAVHLNTQLWNILAVDVASDENALPKETRAQIISLALYSQKTGLSVLRGDVGVDALIEVNRPIIDGLSGKSTSEQDMMQGAA